MKRRQIALLVIAMFFSAALYGQWLQMNRSLSEHASATPVTFEGGMSFKLAEENSIHLSEKRIKHILYGDETGGGHKHGMNKPCKSEFPEDWTDEKIITAIKKIATDETINWKQQDNGNFVANTKEDSLKIRIVLNEDRSEIITAYPTNVPRNPCNAANDNNP